MLRLPHAGALVVHSGHERSARYHGVVNLPHIVAITQLDSSLSLDALIVAAWSHGEDVTVLAPHLDGTFRLSISTQLQTMGLGLGAEDCHTLPAPEGLGAKKVIVLGVTSDTPDADTLRAAAGRGVRAAGPSNHIGMALPLPDDGAVQAAIEGALLGGYRVRARKKLSDDAQWTTLSVLGELHEETTQRARAMAQAVWFVRDLVNTPPNQLYPESFTERVREELADLPVEIEVWDEKRLADEGFGGLVGVGGGSARPPRLVALRYQPANPVGHLALVGKGITFDSGGLSLKPAASMVGMKYDMTGAATVSGAIAAAARLGAPTAITGWLCLAENMPSGTAQRPGDVITIRGGTTVEVLNTDAEGRLVLADGLQAASEESPDLIVDIATLTGAARIALGERYAGLMGADAACALVSTAAAQAGELVWQMPLPEELRKGLSSDVADIANVATGSSLGGMLVAGLFLREFVGTRGEEPDAPSIPWAHLDIAGPASNSSSAYDYTPKGPTGALTRTLAQLALGFTADTVASLRQ